MIDRRTIAGSETNVMTRHPGASTIRRVFSVDKISTAVVLPAPLGRAAQRPSPRPTSKEMSRNAATEPNDLADAFDIHTFVGL
jgi:hypothetical protein